MFLLDANILSDLERNSAGPVATKLEENRNADVATSVVVAAEVWFGVEKEQSRRLAEATRKLFGRIQVLPLKPPVDEVYGRIRAHLARLGTPIGPNDLFIAAHALALDAVLVTDNEKEFSRVPGLKIENWLRA